MDPARTPPWVRRAVLAAVCAGVVAALALIAGSIGSRVEGWSSDPAAANFNLLVRGFQAGQLNLKKEAPPGLAKLADPYDPRANEPYRGYPYLLHDLSYYGGKLYLYFGVVPAVVLFWPWAEITGHYLFHYQAGVIFCCMGFLAGVGMLLCGVAAVFSPGGARRGGGLRFGSRPGERRSRPPAEPAYLRGHDLMRVRHAHARVGLGFCGLAAAVAARPVARGREPVLWPGGWLPAVPFVRRRHPGNSGHSIVARRPGTPFVPVRLGAGRRGRRGPSPSSASG